MKQSNLFIIAAVILALLVAGVFLFWLNQRPGVIPPRLAGRPTLEAAARALPKVVTLYQKGEGESDLAVFVSGELARKYGSLADFQSVDTLDNPQLAEFYGVTSVPTVVFLTPAGKIFRKHEGYLDQNGILGALRSLKAK